MKNQKSIAIGYFATMITMVIAMSIDVEAAGNETNVQTDRVELPSFELSLMGESGVVNRESLKGEYYLLHIWSAECPISTKEMPYLHELYWEMSGEEFDIVSVSIDQNQRLVENFIKQVYPMPWTHANVGREMYRLQPFVSDFDLDGFPVKILVSPEGEVMDINQGFGGPYYINKIEDLISGSEYI